MIPSWRPLLVESSSSFLAVIDIGGCTDAVGAGAEVGGVEIQGEDFFLCELAFNLQREGNRFDLAQVETVAIEREVVS